jgi:hypothetical protein
MSFAPVRLDGGGCCNAHALNAAGTVMVALSDTQGAYLSATSPIGQKWTVQNTGIGTSTNYRFMAAGIWSAAEANVVYALTGDKGSGGAFLAGTYSGGNITWAVRSAVPQAAGGTRGATPANLPSSGWQRSTGRLLYQDSLYLFAATYQQGILRSSNTGGTGVAGTDDFPTACTMTGTAPGTGNWFATAIAPDPNSTSNLWAAFYDSSGNPAGLWKTTTAHGGTPNFTAVSMTAGPTQGIEDIYLVGQYLYCCAGNQGVYRYGPLNGSPAWAALNGATVPTASTNWWCTVAGYVDGSSNHVMIIGDANPSSPFDKTLMQLTIPSNYPTGSITYASLTGSVQSTTVPTPGGSYTWWIPAQGLHVYLGASGYICPFVTVDASNLAAVKLYCAGSGGAYRNVGSGWTVANSGMPMFLAHPVAASPARAGHVVWGDSDWCLFDDTNPGGENATTLQNDPPVSSTQGQAVAFSADGNTVYGSQGAKYTNSGGEVWSRPWNQPANWTALGLKAKTGGKVAIGLAAVSDDPSGSPVLLAAVWASGLWRYDGSAWTSRNASIGASGSAGNQLPVTYYGHGLAFADDSKTGIWRSADYGKTWTLIWAKTSTSELSRTCAYDVTRPGRLWVSAAGKLYKLDGADTGTVAGGGITGAGTTVNPAGVPQAGPVAADGRGNIILAAQDTGSGSGLWMTGSDGAAWADITGGDGSFSRCNSRPEFISAGVFEAAAGASRIYVSGSNVVAQGYPASSAPQGTSSAFTELQSSLNTLAAAGVLPVWFGQAGGVASTRGTMLSARLEMTDGTATVTPADPAWVLDSDIAAAAGLFTSRVQIWRYSNNAGGIAGPALAQVITPASARAGVQAAYGGQGTGVISGAWQGAAPVRAAAPQVIAGTVVPANPVIFTSTNTSAILKGKLFEYASGAGTVQSLDQTGTASAVASATSLPVTASAANAYTGGLAVVDFAAFWSVNGSGQSWTTPGGWTQDGVLNNQGLNFATYYQTGIGAGPITVTGTINPGSGGTMTSWAASLATYYALAGTPVSITTTSVPAATQNSAYTPFSFAAGGGSPPYAWAVTGGAIPAGMAFSPSGVLSGTPSGTGSSSFTVTVTDSAAQAASQGFTITVAGSISVTTSSLPNGQTGVDYLQFLAASGGTPPYSWAITAGALPPGLALTSGNAPGAGTIAGVPLATGTYSFTAHVSDTLGAAGTRALSITVTAGPLTVLTADLPPGVLGQPYAAQLQATGGVAPYTWAVTAGTLPPGLSLASSGAVTGTLTGSGDYPFTATVTDSS